MVEFCDCGGLLRQGLCAICDKKQIARKKKSHRKKQPAPRSPKFQKFDKHPPKGKPSSHKKKGVAIFWDYDNVPLRQGDGLDFLFGLENYIHNHVIRYAKIYYRPDMLSSENQSSLQRLNTFKFKAVQQVGKNAVDYSLMHSCQSVVNSRNDINHVLLITGDNDFIPLVQFLKKLSITCSIIGQERQLGQNLRRKGYEYSFVRDVTDRPHDWWKYIPLDNEYRPYKTTPPIRVPSLVDADWISRSAVLVRDCPPHDYVIIDYRGDNPVRQCSKCGKMESREY